MTKETKDKIYSVAKLIGAFTVIQGAILAISSPFINEYIDNRVNVVTSSLDYKQKNKKYVEQYINSPEFSIFVDGIISDYEEELSKRDSGTLKLRILLAMKMGVDEDEVHIELGKAYKDYRKFKITTLELLNKIVTVLTKLDSTVKIEVPR